MTKPTIRPASRLLAVLLLAVAGFLLTGCTDTACSGHGGLNYSTGKWDVCNDGTWQVPDYD
jgi:hypothetical protein